MEMKPNKLDELKGRNPFKVPQGYMEGLTEQIMAGIPKVTPVEAKVISMRDRIRPWLYVAAVFAGLLIAFKVFIYPVSQDTAQQNNVSSNLQAVIMSDILQDITDDDLEYLEFIEDQYLDRELAEEIDNMDY
jgi:hypothetical protein